MFMKYTLKARFYSLILGLFIAITSTTLLAKNNEETPRMSFFNQYWFR